MFNIFKTHKKIVSELADAQAQLRGQNGRITSAAFRLATMEAAIEDINRQIYSLKSSMVKTTIQDFGAIPPKRRGGNNASGNS